MKTALLLGVLLAGAGWHSLAAEPPDTRLALRDLDGNGKISAEEATTAIADKIMKQTDTSGDGVISRQEARAETAAAKADDEKTRQEKLRQFLFDFDKMDRNGDGKVTRQELEQYLKTDPQVRDFVKERCVKPRFLDKEQEGPDDTIDFGYRYKF